jgi:hypothetical protein
VVCNVAPTLPNAVVIVEESENVRVKILAARNEVSSQFSSSNSEPVALLVKPEEKERSAKGC